MDKNAPAFPINEFYDARDNMVVQHFGVTVRDYFAAKALPAVYEEFWRSADSCPPDWEIGIALDSYRLADAMLKTREQTP